MSEKFSATLRIGDLNDYIAPSQGCVVSLKGLKATSTNKAEVKFLGPFIYSLGPLGRFKFWNWWIVLGFVVYNFRLLRRVIIRVQKSVNVVVSGSFFFWKSCKFVGLLFLLLNINSSIIFWNKFRLFCISDMKVPQVIGPFLFTFVYIVIVTVPREGCSCYQTVE